MTMTISFTLGNYRSQNVGVDQAITDNLMNDPEVRSVHIQSLLYRDTLLSSSCELKHKTATKDHLKKEGIDKESRNLGVQSDDLK